MTRNSFRSIVFWSVALVAVCGPADAQQGQSPRPSPGIVPSSPKSEKQIEQRGKLGLPLNTKVTLKGTVVDGPFKGYDGGPNLRVRYINGVATQKDIQLTLREEFSVRGDSTSDRSERGFRFGESYEIIGHEVGEFVGVNPNSKQIVQAAPRHFHYFFEVEQRRTINPSEFTPDEFVGREALFEGTARTVEGEPSIVAGDWRLIVRPKDDWDDSFVGHRVEVFGKISRSSKPGVYRVEPAIPRLVDLKDQKGRKVSLRGAARSMNGHWWFYYRGQNLYVDNMDKLPDWSAENHFRPMQIDGTLDEADLPDVKDVGRVSAPPLRKHFIVRNASWKPLPPLLAPERLDNANPPW
ncbi:MAG: hypothetical protein IT428_28290 [Planctomycetaceae bacterium]|nr:hypothetical protein [Planctomycetaceae bacterium]